MATAKNTRDKDGASYNGNSREGRTLNNKRLFEQPTGDVRYAESDPGKLQQAIEAICSVGGCIIFSITSDGGAYSVTAIVGNERVKEYPNTPARLNDVLDALVQWAV